MEEKTLDINGIKTFVRIAGEGNPFLVLHGWGANIDSWKKVQEKLSAKFKVIILDLPGFGKSDLPPSAWGVQDYVQFVLDFLCQMGTEKFYLLGHSFGGRIAIKLAAQRPEKINKLVLVDAAGIKLRKKFINNLIGTLASFFNLFYLVPGFKIARKIFYRFILRKTDYFKAVGVMKETFKKVVVEDLTSYLERIQISTLIIWGKKDKLTPVKDAYLMHQKIKNSQLKILDCAHCPHFEKIDELANIIFEFI